MAHKSRSDLFQFDVTIRSHDSGWSYYADSFEMLGQDGRVLATHKLLYPHDDEQPFTHSSDNVRIPSGIGSITIRAHHKPAGYNGAVFKVDLPR